MKKVIFVNATACTSGGVLSILNQFIENILKYNEDNIYYIFSIKNIKDYYKNIIFINDIKGKKKMDRILWDLSGMKRWSKQNGIKPDLIISLQNTGVVFNKVKQIVYLHQSLPYAKESKWSLFKSDERKLWVYKNIYKWWIDLTVKKYANVIVQNQWMKEALIARGYKREKITVSMPNVKNIEIKKVQPIIFKEKYFFYPAADYKYKNHIILIKAVKEIMNNNLINDKFKIIFTLTKKSDVYRKIIEYGVEDYFELIGNINFQDVLKYYKGCHAVLFPSYIETIGLPLIEASMFGKKILVADCKYSKEVLRDNKLARFVSYNSVNNWREEIELLLNDYKEKPINIKQKTSWSNMFELINNILDLK